MRRSYPTVTRGPDLFSSSLAGIVDTDGSVCVVRSGKYAKLILTVFNEDLRLLAHIKNELVRADYLLTGPYLQAAEGCVTQGLKIPYNSDMWSLYLQRAEEVRDALKLVPLRHEGKVLRKELALRMEGGARWTDIEGKVRYLQNQIRDDVRTYVANAEAAYKKAWAGVG